LPRPIKQKKVNFKLETSYFKPRAVPLSKLEEEVLSPAELEAIRLHDIQDCNQARCAKKMRISPSTFQRILKSGHQKIAQALIKGRAIRIEKQNE